MDKKEKAVKGLEACSTEPETGEECQRLGCPYWDSDAYCVQAMIMDALDALKGAKNESDA